MEFENEIVVKNKHKIDYYRYIVCTKKKINRIGKEPIKRVEEKGVDVKILGEGA